MFTVKKLRRVKTIVLDVRPLYRKYNNPIQERAAIINMHLNNGMTYAQAIQAFDTRMKVKNGK